MSRLVMPYIITLQAPLVLTQPGGDANSAKTLPFISGSAVLGALAAQWKRAHNKTGNLAHDQAFSEIFLSSQLRCAHAYPVRKDGIHDIRLLPSPLSLWQDKYQDERLVDMANREISGDTLREPGLRPWPTCFIQISEGAIQHAFPEQQAMIHHQRDREKGRATKDTGSVFSYISLNPGQKFKGYFYLEEEQLAETIRQIAGQGSLFLGRSKTTQYGGNVTIDLLPEEKAEDFIEEGQNNPFHEDRLVITLVSDYLGRDSKGHFRADTETWLQEFNHRLNPDRTAVALDPEMSIPVFARTSRVSGYVAPWHMPRPIRPALAAGTVLVLKAETLNMEDLQKLLWTGLGERRAEGFGRFILDWHGYDEDLADGYSVSRIPVQPPELSDASDQNSDLLVSLSQKNILQRALFEQCQHYVTRLGRSASQIPPKSALGRVRQILREAENNDQIRSFVTRCQSTEQINKPFVRHLASCRLGNQTLLEWLNKVYTDDAFLQNALNFDELKKRYYLLDKREAERTLMDLLPVFRDHVADLFMQELSRKKKDAEAREGDDE